MRTLYDGILTKKMQIAFLVCPGEKGEVRIESFGTLKQGGNIQFVVDIKWHLWIKKERENRIWKKQRNGETLCGI